MKSMCFVRRPGESEGGKGDLLLYVKEIIIQRVKNVKESLYAQSEQGFGEVFQVNRIR